MKMKKIIIGFAALMTLASPVLARDYQRAGNVTYTMSSKMRGASAGASYAAMPYAAGDQREWDRAESALSR
jgi:hypothetical protein